MHLGDSDVPEQHKVPWMDIMTSVPVWATIFAHFASGWVFYLIVVTTPMFAAEALQYDIISVSHLCLVAFKTKRLRTSLASK